MIQYILKNENKGAYSIENLLLVEPDVNIILNASKKTIGLKYEEVCSASEAHHHEEVQYDGSILIIIGTTEGVQYKRGTSSGFRKGGTTQTYF